MNGCHIGPFGVPDLGKGIPGAQGQEFFHGLFRHGQAVNGDLFNPFPQQFYRPRIGYVFNIDKGNIALGTAAHLEQLYPQGGIPDAAPDQGRIKDKGFGKTVPGTPGDPFDIGFLRPPGGVFPGINDDCFPLPVDQEGDGA